MSSTNVMMDNISPEVGLKTVSPEQSVYATPVATNVGTNVRSVGWSFMVALLIVSFIILLYLLFDTPKEIVQNFIHKSCYKDGACSQPKCPMNDPTNPFSVIQRNNKMAFGYLNEMQQLHTEFIQDMESIPDEIKAEAGITEFLSTRVQVSTNLLNMATLLVKQSSEINNKAILLDMSKPIKDAFILQHKSTALLNGIQVLKYLQVFEFKSYTIKIISQLLNEKLTADSQSSSQIQGAFTKQLEKYTKVVQDMTAINGDLTKPSAPTFDLIDKLNTLLSEASPSIDNIVTSISDTSEVEKKIVKQLESINKVHQFMLALFIEMQESFVTERFDDREPGKVTPEMANKDIEDNNYNDTIIQMSLEPSILENHKSFADERNRIDTGAGMYGVRDDPNDVIPWVGLFRPTYKRSDGSSAESSKMPLKAVPSDRPESQMQQRVKLVF